MEDGSKARPLTADGGVCAPMAPRYDVFTIAGGIPEDSPGLVRAVDELRSWWAAGGANIVRSGLDPHWNPDVDADLTEILLCLDRGDSDPEAWTTTAVIDAIKALYRNREWDPPVGAVEDFARQAARVAILAYQRTPVEDSLPRISAPRGGISYLPPPGAGPRLPLPRWRRAALKARSALGAPARVHRRVEAARGRLRDARAVWRGEKDALSEAEQEALSDY